MIQITFKNETELFTITTQTSCKLSDILQESKGNLPMPCAGKGHCGKCKVQTFPEATPTIIKDSIETVPLDISHRNVEDMLLPTPIHKNIHLATSTTGLICVSGLLSPLTAIELKQLTPAERANGIRLACCAHALGNLSIETTIHKNELIQIETELPLIGVPKDIAYDNYGIVVDIGTTTLVLKLLSKTKIIATASMLNPQVNYGSDVVSRMESSLAGNGHILQKQIISGINEMIETVCNEDSTYLDSGIEDSGVKNSGENYSGAKDSGVEDTRIQYSGIPNSKIKGSKLKRSMIDYALITGNTTMLFLLLNYSVKSIATAPFCADELFGKQYSTKEIALNISSNAKIDIPFCISAFVGADITTAITYCDFYKSKKNELLVDIGTNGEIALWHNQKLSVASTAAGPAFEGAGIQMGMNGKIGAIDTMFIEHDKIKYTVIGNVTPKGFCGSGIISAIATMIDANIIDETGEMIFDNDTYKQYETEFDENPAFIIDHILITQKDIRMVQLAKSALCAGIKTVVSIANLSFDQIDTLYIAGGFGTHLNIVDAIKIGLIPKELLHKTKVVGNASLGGGVMLAFDKHLKPTLAKIAQEAEVIDLAGSKLFSDAYIDGMMFE